MLEKRTYISFELILTKSNLSLKRGGKLKIIKAKFWFAFSP